MKKNNLAKLVSSLMFIALAGCGTVDQEPAEPLEPPVANFAPTDGKADSFDQRCSNPDLVWKSANKTNYTSHPDPGSAECVQYNGCQWAGQFAYCSGTFSESWVSAHNIASVFPSTGLRNHDLCLRAGNRTIVVTVVDTCADSDCSGCCTQNRGSADRLIDLESYTNARFGVGDGRIQWADLGPRRTGGGSCNVESSTGFGSTGSGSSGSGSSTTGSSSSGSSSSCQYACATYNYREGQCRTDSNGNTWDCDQGCLNLVDSCGGGSTASCQYPCEDYNYRAGMCLTDSNGNTWSCDGECIHSVASCG